jgi:hypothetical protein
MKNLIFFVWIIGLYGCGNNKPAKLIESFVCTKDGVTSDLGFKKIQLKETSPLTATDSMLYFIIDTIPINYAWKSDSLSFTYLNENGILKSETISKSQIDSELVFWVSQRDEGEKSLLEANANIKDVIKNSRDHSFTYESFMGKLFKSSMESSEKLVEISKDKIRRLNLAKKYSYFLPDTRLLRAFDCTYSLYNPILKVRQTQSQTFYFTKDLAKVVSSSGIKK